MGRINRRINGRRRLFACAAWLAGSAVALALSGCGQENTQYHYPESSKRGSVYTDQKKASVFGEGGLDIGGIFGGGDKGQQGPGGTTVGVNAYLWRASLDTIAFMPLSSADIFGGVIITDWYTPPETPDERFKMSVYILGRELRADGVKVAVFRQRHSGNGAWIDTDIGKETATNLENQILTRARQLRLATAQK